MVYQTSAAPNAQKLLKDTSCKELVYLLLSPIATNKYFLLNNLQNKGYERINLRNGSYKTRQEKVSLHYRWWHQDEILRPSYLQSPQLQEAHKTNPYPCTEQGVQRA